MVQKRRVTEEHTAQFQTGITPFIVCIYIYIYTTSTRHFNGRHSLQTAFLQANSSLSLSEIASIIFKMICILACHLTFIESTSAENITTVAEQ